jgi:HSP90 family molecular chaperone
MIHDSANRMKLVKLLRFKSTKNDEPISMKK